MGVKLSELPQINAALSAATAWAKSAASAAAPPSLRATHAKRPALALVYILQIDSRSPLQLKPKKSWPLASHHRRLETRKESPSLALLVLAMELSVGLCLAGTWLTITA